MLDQPLELDNDEAGQVLAWRELCFLKLGARPELAADLALSQVDLHAYAQLVERGCAPELAARILR